MEDTDILVSGAGIAGMILAALLARRGYRVTICDPAPPPGEPDAEGSDLRTTAYLAPSVELLQEAGLWEALAPDATSLAALRVMDSTGWPPRQRATRTFTPADLGLDSFGRNVMNWRARKTLAETLDEAENVDLRLGTGFAGMLSRDDRALVTLSDGTRIGAKLVVGADGRASPVREAAGIGVRTHRYGQKALAFACTHAEPHEGVSTEIYNSGGAFVTVPLADHEGCPASSIVWMAEGARAMELTRAGAEDFDSELTARALHVVGPMRRITPLRLWPIVTQTAARMTARRTVLVAEAAHVLPPIGAQGLNTSIADIRALAGAIGPGDPGAPAGLATYARERERDMRGRAAAIDAYNRLCSAGDGPLQLLRGTGLKVVHDIAPLRRRAMGLGMGG